MGPRVLWHLPVLSFCLLFSSGTGIARILGDEENQEIFSSYEFETQLDGVPVVNPTTPGTANPSPLANPTSPQTPDTTWQTPTTPYMTPITPDSPMTAPTTPPTNPTTFPTNPTAPPANPTTTPAIPTAPPANPATTPTTPTTTSPTSSGGQWCVASQTASETALQVALDFACGYGGADCSAIQAGASCYNPNTVRDHASYAFNAYYQKNPSPTSCSFGGIAQLTNKDPSTGNCRYTTPKSQSMSPPTYQSPPTNQSPLSQSNPMTTTPPSVTMPGGSTIFGSGPTQSPSFASSPSHSLLLMFTMCSLWASLLTANII